MNLSEIAKQQDSIVASVIGHRSLTGFQRAYTVSTAIGQLKALLTDDYMKPIMELQGTKLGFKTDKDKNGGYAMEVVRTCLIEAVFRGLNPYGNQFNIISGSMYPTKEGCGFLLNTREGLKYSIVCKITKLSADKTSAEVDATIKWSEFGGKEEAEIIPIPLKIDSYTSVDAIVGKATRKARAWLLSRLDGVETVEGNVEDLPMMESETKLIPEGKPNITDDEFQKAVNDGVSLEDLSSEYAITPEQIQMFNDAKK